MDVNAEIGRLRDLMPATGRMKTRIRFDRQQPQLIMAALPRPWQRTYPVTLNLVLWQRLSEPQRDLLFLRTVSWLTSSSWLQPRGWVIATGGGLLGAGLELMQMDMVGLLTASGLSIVAGLQIWRSLRGPRQAIAADEAAIAVAQRRGYSQRDAVRALLEAIEAVPELEGRSGLDLSELLRAQNLRAKSGLSGVAVPEEFLQT